MRLTLHPDAERDVAEAAAFYEREGAPAVAARFLKEFRRVGALLQMQPEIGTPRGGGRRGHDACVSVHGGLSAPAE